MPEFVFAFLITHNFLLIRVEWFILNALESTHAYLCNSQNPEKISQLLPELWPFKVWQFLTSVANSRHPPRHLGTDISGSFGATELKLSSYFPILLVHKLWKNWANQKLWKKWHLMIWHGMTQMKLSRFSENGFNTISSL